MIPGSANPLLLATAAAGGYSISRSVRFNSSDSAYLSRTPASAGNRQSWSWSGWVKRSALITGSNRQVLFGAYGAGNDTDWLEFGFDYNTTVDGLYWTTSNATSASAAVFRDVSAWYHVVVNYNGSTLRAFVNSVQVLASSLSGNLGINGAWVHTIGKGPSSSIRYFDGYLADIHFIDGQALDPTSFGEFDVNGIWQPIAYSGTYGTNGFHLDFSDNSTAAALGTDTSGNGNTWTVNNISANTGGPTSVASASGGLPIYNTTDTYGTTKGTGTRTDSNSSSVSLAIPMDGTNGGTTFADESATIKGSGSAKSITRVGNTQTSTTQSKYYGSSGYFDGTGDYLTVANSSDFDFGSGNYTLEVWVYPTDVSVTRNILSRAYDGGTGNYSGFILSTANFLETTTQTAWDVTITKGLSANIWQHLAVVRSGNTWTYYINGVASGTATASGSVPTGPGDLQIGRRNGQSEFQGYMSDVRIYKGVAKYTGNFNPPSATQNATIAAGNDSLVDVPTNGSEVDTGSGGQVRGNYCTLNPLDGGSATTLSNGNLDIDHPTSTTWRGVRGTIGVSSGKYYFEYTFRDSGQTEVGIANSSTSLTTYPGSSSGAYIIYTNGQIANNNSFTNYGSSLTTGDVLGVAVDLDNNKIWFSKNGAYPNSGDPAAGTNAAFTSITSSTYFPVVGVYTTTSDGSINFGARSFAYTAPTGFKALCTANLPAPVVTKPSDLMSATLWTGTGSSQNITTDFSPDFVWIKRRDTGSTSHCLHDVIRGATKGLHSDSTQAEWTDTATLTAFNSNGFTLGGHPYTNGSGGSYVGWAWDAGSSTVTNTQGSISSQVRANASAGFSIVTYTGAGSAGTIGHGLGVTPAMLIVKQRTGTGAPDWGVWHTSLGGGDKFLYLSNTSSVQTNTTPFNGTLPTSSVFSVGTWSGTNQSAATYVAYCFAPVAGYSSFGSYTGNGSTDGPFVYTGHRVKYLMVKRTDSTGDWFILDGVREPYNYVSRQLGANNSGAESGPDAYNVDFTSNGFKIRNSVAGFNASSGSYVYISFAENPFQYARAR